MIVLLLDPNVIWRLVLIAIRVGIKSHIIQQMLGVNGYMTRCLDYYKVRDDKMENFVNKIRFWERSYELGQLENK